MSSRSSSEIAEGHLGDMATAAETNGEDRWWLVRPRSAGSTWQGGRRKKKAQGAKAVGEKQIPGLATFTGCWKCGDAGHRAAECKIVAAEAAEQWIAEQIAELGAQLAQVKLAELLKRARSKAQVMV